MTDTLVDLLIATVHRVGARAETKVTKELVNAPEFRSSLVALGIEKCL